MNCSNNAPVHGFRIVGSLWNDRRRVNWASAFQAYSQCDEQSEVTKEAYLSAFTFGDEFAWYLEDNGTTKGYAGECGAAWLWFDIDREGDIDTATADARKLATSLAFGYDIGGDALLCFFSGRKGFHIGFPLSACGSPGPSALFHDVCRRFAESIASQAEIAIDAGVYDRVRAFRAPNSRHPKTGRFKRWLSFDALVNLKATRIEELAATPEPFEIPDPPEASESALSDWAAAVRFVDEQRNAIATRRELGDRSALNRATLEFIREGATTGDRHRLLFSAAANLAEFGCSVELALALLTEPALDSGLSPSDVRRQIECGLKHREGMQ